MGVVEMRLLRLLAPHVQVNLVAVIRLALGVLGLREKGEVFTISLGHFVDVSLLVAGKGDFSD